MKWLLRWLLSMGIDVNRLSDQEIERLTLEWVNQQRAKRGMMALATLKSGERKHSQTCSIARSLSDGKDIWTDVNTHRVLILKSNGSREQITPSEEVKAFILRFDSGKYQHLIYRDPTA